MKNYNPGTPQCSTPKWVTLKYPFKNFSITKFILFMTTYVLSEYRKSC